MSYGILKLAYVVRFLQRTAPRSEENSEAVGPVFILSTGSQQIYATTHGFPSMDRLGQRFSCIIQIRLGIATSHLRRWPYL